MRRIDETGTAFGKWKCPARTNEAAWRLPLGCTLAHPATMFRKHAVAQVGGYDPQKLHAQDYDLWCRMVRAGHEIRNLPINILDYRLHSSQVSSTFSAQQNLTALSIAGQHLEWALERKVELNAVQDLRALCSAGLALNEISGNRARDVAQLVTLYVQATKIRYGSTSSRQAARYFVRKLIKASATSAMRRTGSTDIFLKAASKITASTLT